jgi:NAD-dependent SIR2 family protein deacetylase
MNHQKTVLNTGAGISKESGIQLFRGKNGTWNENPMEIANFATFESKPADFLIWYFSIVSFPVKMYYLMKLMKYWHSKK